MMNFILIAVFLGVQGPRVAYVQLGEFTTIEKCQVAAREIKKQGDAFDVMGHVSARFMCAPK